MGGYTGECGYDEETEHDVCWCNGCDCIEGQIECVGDDIRSCEDGCLWSTYSCEDVCADSGGYTGECSYDEEKEHDVCYCWGEGKKRVAVWR